MNILKGICMRFASLSLYLKVVFLVKSIESIKATCILMKTTQSKIAVPAWAAPGEQERAWRVKSKQRIPRTVR